MNDASTKRAMVYAAIHRAADAVEAGEPIEVAAFRESVTIEQVVNAVAYRAYKRAGRPSLSDQPTNIVAKRRR